MAGLVTRLGPLDPPPPDGHSRGRWPDPLVLADSALRFIGPLVISRMPSPSVTLPATIANDLTTAKSGHRVESAARRHGIEALLVGALVVVVLLLWRTPPELLAPGVFRDDGVYVALGRAISDGRGYHSIYLPGAPLQVKYPPGLPVLYALLWRVFGTLHEVYSAAGILSLLATASAGAIVWFLARAQLALSPVIALPLAIGPVSFDSAGQYYSLPISESWYALLWGLVVLVAFRVCAKANPRSSRDAFLLGLLLAAAMLVRSQAVALFVAALAALVLARRWRPALIAGITGATPIVAWQTWLAAERARGALLSTLPDESGYVNFVSNGTTRQAVHDVAANLWLNTRLYFDAFVPFLSAWYAVGAVICLAIVILGAIGAWRSGRERLILPLTVATSGALTLLWPWTQDRLLIPLLPFAGLLAAVTLQTVANRLPRVGRLAGAGMLGLVAIGAAYQQVSLRSQTYEAYAHDAIPAHMSPTWYLPQNSRALTLESLWISKHARADDRLLAASPAGLYLRTGRTGLSSSPAESRLATPVFAVPGRFLSHSIADVGISLVIVDGPDKLNRDVAVVRQACPNAFHTEAQGSSGWPIFLRVVDPDCIARAFQ